MKDINPIIPSPSSVILSVMEYSLPEGFFAILSNVMVFLMKLAKPMLSDVF